MGAYESAYSSFSVAPATHSNTVMRGGETNFLSILSNNNDNAISEPKMCWNAVSTSSWVRVVASNGVLDPSDVFVFSMTNTALSLAPGTHLSRLYFYPTNNPMAQHYPQTGVVDITLRVAEMVRSASLVTSTIRQGGWANSTVQVWNSGSGELPYTVLTNTSWLNVWPVSGTLTGQTDGATNELTLTFTNAPVAMGTYYGAVTLVSGIDSSELNINVELTVTTGPQMLVNPLIMTGSVMKGQSAANQTFRVANASASEPVYYRVEMDQSWINVDNTNVVSGLVAALGTNEHTVNYLSSGLTTNSQGPSNYHGTITITATNPAYAIGSPAAISVNLAVNPKPSLVVSATLLTGTVTEGHDASNCTFEVWNGNGYYTLSYAVSDDNADWLVMTPSSGTSTGQHAVITCQFSTAGFAPGQSNAVITVVGRAYDGLHWDSADNATQDVYVVLTINPIAALATDAASRYDLPPVRQGHPVGATSFRVWNAGAAGGNGGTLVFTAASANSWITATPASGTSAGEMEEVVMTCDVAGLPPGKHYGALTLSGIDQRTGVEAYNSPTSMMVEVTIIGGKGFDFGGDGNGACDLVVYNETLGLWKIINLYSGYTLTNMYYGGAGYEPLAGDYDGDMISDAGLYRYASGYWYVKRLSDNLLAQFGGNYWAGPRLVSKGGFVQVASDYDGDGKTDPAMYNETSGMWSALFSGSAYMYASGVFGGPGYAAIPADYDGDGITDYAIYNEMTSQWIALYSSDKYSMVSGLFGGPGYTAEPADYDGDGLADPCIYNEAAGHWIILKTGSGYALVVLPLGGPGFKPVPADYNGDGKADACLYNEATGNWFIMAIDGTRIAWPVNFGGYGFEPVKP